MIQEMLEFDSRRLVQKLGIVWSIHEAAVWHFSRKKMKLIC